MLIFLPFAGEGLQQAEAIEKATVNVSSIYQDRRGLVVKAVVSVQHAENLAGGVIELSYDSDVALATSLTKGDVIGDSLYVENMENANAGKVRVAFASSSILESNGELLVIDLRLLHRNQKNSTNLTLSDVQLYDVNGNPLVFNTYDGFIKPFDGVNKGKKDNVQNNKNWTVEFNSAMDPSTLNKHNIYVVNTSTGEQINIRIKPSSDKKSIDVKPVGNYTRGNYTLTVTEQVRSAAGTPLKEPVQLEFTVR